MIIFGIFFDINRFLEYNKYIINCLGSNDFIIINGLY